MNKADLLILSFFQLLINKIDDAMDRDRFFLAKICLMLLPPFAVIYFIVGVLTADVTIFFRIIYAFVTVAIAWMIWHDMRDLSHVRDVEKRAEFLDDPKDAIDAEYGEIIAHAAIDRFSNLIFGIIFASMAWAFTAAGWQFGSRYYVALGAIFILRSFFLYILSCANPPGKKQKKLVLQRQTN